MSCDDSSSFEHVEIDLPPGLLAADDKPSASAAASFTLASALNPRSSEWSHLSQDSSLDSNSDFEIVSLSRTSLVRDVEESTWMQGDCEQSDINDSSAAKPSTPVETGREKDVISSLSANETQQSGVKYFSTNPKTEILQLLSCQCIDAAAEVYKNHTSFALDDKSKTEIFYTAQHFFANDVVNFYFPGLEQFGSTDKAFPTAAIDKIESPQQDGRLHMETTLSYDANARLQSLLDRVQDLTRKVTISRIKSEIIQFLIQNAVVSAGDVYQKNKDTLCNESKYEISTYAYQILDDDVVSYYFPELPHATMPFKDFGMEHTETLEEFECQLSQTQQSLDNELRQISS